jgi:hypothetical protein
MHYAQRNGQDPEEEIERAVSNWSEQCEELAREEAEIKAARHMRASGRGRSGGR